MVRSDLICNWITAFLCANGRRTSIFGAETSSAALLAFPDMPQFSVYSPPSPILHHAQNSPGARGGSQAGKHGAVAYQSQFQDATGGGHLGQQRIKSALCSIGGLDPDEWDFPPKPKWRRWKTYERHERKFDRYEAVSDDG
jgi:hypothetical protein